MKKRSVLIAAPWNVGDLIVIKRGSRFMIKKHSRFVDWRHAKIIRIVPDPKIPYSTILSHYRLRFSDGEEIIVSERQLTLHFHNLTQLEAKVSLQDKKVGKIPGWQKSKALKAFREYESSQTSSSVYPISGGRFESSRTKH